MTSILSLVLAASFAVFGFQTTTSPPITIGTPTPPAPTQTPTQSDIKNRQLAGTRDSIDVINARVNMMLRQRYVDPLYRKPTDEELKAVAVDQAIRTRFADVLAMPKAGIFKLIPDRGCAESLSVVSASDDCSKFNFPGAGNAFSFRTNNYRPRSLADLTFRSDGFFVPGEMVNGMMVDLGDVPVGSVDKTANGLDYLANFQPATDRQSFETKSATLKRGVVSGQFRYASSAKLAIDRTYAIRSIAYRGEIIKTIQGATYNELDFDKRRDVIVVFRPVAIDPDGAVTIVWHEIRNIEAPKIKREK